MNNEIPVTDIVWFCGTPLTYCLKPHIPCLHDYTHHCYMDLYTQD